MSWQQSGVSAVQSPGILEIFIMIWFSVSVIAHMIGNFALWRYLRRNGVKLIFSLIGTPGYLDGIYLKLCRSQGRSAKRVLMIRIISMINLVIVGIFVILMLTNSHK